MTVGWRWGRGAGTAFRKPIAAIPPRIGRLSAPSQYLSDLVAKCLVRPTTPGGVPLVRKIQNLQRLGLDVETLWPFVKVRPRMLALGLMWVGRGELNSQFVRHSICPPSLPFHDASSEFGLECVAPRANRQYNTNREEPDSNVSSFPMQLCREQKQGK